MKKKVIFLVFCLLCISYINQAQVPFVTDTTHSAPKFFSNTLSFPPILKNKLQLIPASYYADKLSFFCEKEWKLEKNTGIPFKFRLGSVEQTDYLEGKHGGMQKNSP